MSTDDEIRDAFHSALAPQLATLSVDPAMLSAVRRRHQRQQRVLAVGAPLGVAVITTGAVVGATAVHSSSAGGKASVVGPAGQGTNSTTTDVPMQTVDLVDHTLTVPADWTLGGNRKLIDLDTMNPPQIVGGKDQTVIAKSPDGSQKVTATVYKGPIAAGERQTIVGPDDTMTAIDGKQVAIHYYGSPGPTTDCIAIPANQDGSVDKPDYTTTPCPVTDSRPQADVGVEYGDGDFAIIDTIGLTESQLKDFLATALAENG